MLGNFQQSHLRIELATSAVAIRQQLTSTAGLRQILAPGKLSLNGHESSLQAGDRFTVKIGWLEVAHQVNWINEQGIRLLLHSGIDGYQEWSWGDGWVQSGLTGISLLPLHSIQTWSLLQLQAALGNSKRNHHQAEH
jgi:hypothetical protein